LVKNTPIPVRISRDVLDRAMKAKGKNAVHLDKGSWLSLLILKGLEKLKEEAK